MYTVGIDIGGTFTDLIAIDDEDGRAIVNKAPSTPPQFSTGVLNVLDDSDIDPANVERIVHGTTVTTNAVIERNGSTTGLLLTEGFRDMLELGRRDRPNLWGVGGEYTPLVPRDLCVGIDERTSADGEVTTEVTRAEVREKAEALAARGVESVGICLLNSYINPHNEKVVADVLDDCWPNDHVVRSSAILPEIREFERASTVAISAYTMASLSSYLDRLESKLAEMGYEETIELIQSNGGITSTTVAKTRPANTIMSGPAAGVTAASDIASELGIENVVSGDMGGTSFDIAVLRDGEPEMTKGSELGFQLPIRIPMIDIATIGAGGGSIAEIDAQDILQVGPASAGADPGPVCYGRGGTDVTMTDANLVLKRINPGNPIEEGLHMDVEQARTRLRDDIASDLDFSVEEAGTAIVKVAVDKMVGKMREMTVDRGYDPRDFSLVMYGGSGPLHASEILKNSDFTTAIIPYYPGILSALGCLLADTRHDNTRTVNETIEDVDVADLHGVIESLESKGLDLLSGGHTDVDTSYSADMKYRGQSHTITAPLPSASPTEAELRSAFTSAYQAKFSESLDRPVVVDSVQVTVWKASDAVNLRRITETTASGDIDDAILEERDVYFADGWRETPIYDRNQLPFSESYDGPAIVEQDDTTTVINPGVHCSIDENGNLVLTTD